MYAFIDAHRAAYGVEPICRVLEVAPSGSYEHRARGRDPALRPARTQRDDALRVAIRRVHRDHHEVYGVRKVWRPLRRDGEAVARCTVERLMRAEGLRGVVRGRRVRTTTPDAAAERARDLVRRDFAADAPNTLWVRDFTHVATGTPLAWRGFVYVAFVIDVFSRRIVGWRAHTAMRTELVLDALEQALYDREVDGRLVVHSDRGSQYVAMRYTERLAAAGAAPSVGSAGDAYDCEYAGASLRPRLTLHTIDFVSLR